MDTLVTTLLDADIYGRDVDLFLPRNWLNDSCINYCLRQFEIQLSNQEILLMDPSVVSFLRIQCDDEDEYTELALGQQASLRTWIFMPVNNSESFGNVSTHWSLLLLHTVSARLFHFDSCGNSNKSAALSTSVKLFKLMGWNHQPSIEFIVNSPQQVNSYDCGVYVLLSINFLVKNLANLEIMSQKGGGKVWEDLLDAMKIEVTEATAEGYRKKTYLGIRSLKMPAVA